MDFWFLYKYQYYSSDALIGNPSQSCEDHEKQSRSGCRISNTNLSSIYTGNYFSFLHAFILMMCSKKIWNATSRTYLPNLRIPVPMPALAFPISQSAFLWILKKNHIVTAVTTDHDRPVERGIWCSGRTFNLFHTKIYSIVFFYLYVTRNYKPFGRFMLNSLDRPTFTLCPQYLLFKLFLKLESRADR